MTTALETRILAKIYDKVVASGALVSATFAVISSQTIDPDESTVSTTTTPEAGLISPPIQVDEYPERIGESETLQRSIEFVLMTGAGTSAAIAWTPVLGMSVTWNGATWRITKLEPARTGDNIAAWEITAESA